MLKLETVTEIDGKQSFKTFEAPTKQQAEALAKAYYGKRRKWSTYSLKRIINNWGVNSEAQNIYKNAYKL